MVFDYDPDPDQLEHYAIVDEDFAEGHNYIVASISNKKVGELLTQCIECYFEDNYSFAELDYGKLRQTIDGFVLMAEIDPEAGLKV